MKVLSVLGTRPEAIKMAPVVNILRQHRQIEAHVCVTGQHREMLDQALRIFAITPNFDLNIMQEKQSLSHITSSVLVEVNALLSKNDYDWLLVQGDTTTVMAAAMAAFCNRVQVGHVEAGLRTYDNYRPYPEEVNRRIADMVADFLFAPTEQAKENLIAEGVPESRILVTGNTVVDALQQILSAPRHAYRSRLPIAKGTKLVLLTAHRRENFGQPLVQICGAIKDLAGELGPDVHFLYPVHLNPHVRQTAHRELSGITNVTLTEPLDYDEFIYWLSKAEMVLTDSGGVQEEAVTLGKPLLILRECTERPEAVKAGFAQLVGTDRSKIVGEVRRWLRSPNRMRDGSLSSVFGDGKASERIVNALLGREMTR